MENIMRFSLNNLVTSDSSHLLAVPVVASPIPNQDVNLNSPFHFNVNTSNVFSDSDGDSLKITSSITYPTSSWLKQNFAGPVFSGSYDTSGTATKVTLVGNTAYVADYASGLQIINVTDPKNPTLIGTYNTSGYASDVSVVGNYAYVADSVSGLEIINVSNPANPVLTGNYITSGIAYGVTVVGSHAYVAYGTSGLQIVSITNPASPTLTGSYPTPTEAWTVAIAGNNAYLGYGSGAMYVINISNPANPTLVGSFTNSNSSILKMALLGNYAYAASFNAGMKIIDISNSTNPILAASFTTQGAAEDIAIEGNYAYVSTCGSNSAVQIIDIANITQPTLKDTYSTGPDCAEGIALAGNFAYATTSASGLQILQLTSLNFDGTPGSQDIGVTRVDVTATDKNNGTVSDSFDITVHPSPNSSQNLTRPSILKLLALASGAAGLASLLSSCGFYKSEPQSKKEMESERSLLEKRM